MKKLLILMLVLGISSLANGTMTLQISVGGVLDPIDSEITLMPSETIFLDIHSPDGYNGTEDCYWGLVADIGYGVITGGVPTAAAPAESAWFGNDAATMGFGSPPEDGSWGFIGDSGGIPVGPGVYIDEILFHCVGPGDAVIKLYSSLDAMTFVLEDTVIIHQPEPMTIALLGLGGLFLRRRK